MRRKILLALSMVAILTVLFAFSVSAVEPVESWDISASTEDSVTAYLCVDEANEGMYTLTISGNGDMKHWYHDSAPWRSQYGSKIASAIIENGVTCIGMGSFSDCTSLTSIVISNSVTLIGGMAFCNCTSLTSIEIPSSVALIGYVAFKGCTSLESISIPKGITEIGNEMFYNCESLTSIELPNSVTSIGYGAFLNCSSLIRIEIPNNVTSIDESAFSGCTNLASIVLPKGVTSIGECAFLDCSGLTSVVIPNSVTRIGYYVFRGCTNLTIYCEAESQPSGWSESWNSSNRPVVWGYIDQKVCLDEIVTFKGYSLGPNGQVSFGFDIDYEAKAIGKTLEIGVLFTGYDNLGGRAPLDENGEAITLSKGKVLKINITDLGYQYYDFKMLNIGDEIKNVKLVIAGYLFDGEAVKYVQENGLSDTVTGISYNEIYCECEGHEYYMGSDGVEGVHYVTTVAPTCQMEGERCYICTRCGEANCKTEILPKTEHNYIDGKCEYCNSGSSGNKGEFEDEEI